ncbi:hypothetical protein BGX30_005830 [Mortierella sp. GBA39]|nr:hypothetical protein BGX30_005830 [Mortierella sp. GBA39]
MTPTSYSPTNGTSGLASALLSSLMMPASPGPISDVARSLISPTTLEASVPVLSDSDSSKSSSGGRSRGNLKKTRVYHLFAYDDDDVLAYASEEEERQCSGGRSLMYKLTHPQRYKRELELQLQSQHQKDTSSLSSATSSPSASQVALTPLSPTGSTTSIQGTLQETASASATATTRMVYPFVTFTTHIRLRSYRRDPPPPPITPHPSTQRQRHDPRSGLGEYDPTPVDVLPIPNNTAPRPRASPFTRSFFVVFAYDDNECNSDAVEYERLPGPIAEQSVPKTEVNGGG